MMRAAACGRLLCRLRDGITLRQQNRAQVHAAEVRAGQVCFGQNDTQSNCYTGD